MWFRKNWLAASAVFATVLFEALQIIQWRAHGDDYVFLAVDIVATAVLWVLLVSALFKTCIDRRRAKNLGVKYRPELNHLLLSIRMR